MNTALQSLRDQVVPPRTADLADPELTLRAERVRVAFRQFQTYAALMRRFSTMGGSVEDLRKYAAAAADCLDAATEEFLRVINPDMMREEIEALALSTKPKE